MDARIIRIKEVMRITGRSASSLARDEKLGLFPARRRTGKYSIGWLSSDIEEWLNTLPKVKLR